MRPLLVLCTATLVLVQAPAVQAQWKWKDARGQVHVSDLPPPRDIPQKDILQAPAPASRRAAASAPAPVASAAQPREASASRPSGVDPELEARRARAEAEAKAKAAADEQRAARQRAENCQRARSQLAMLQSGQRIARVDAKGEQYILDDATRAAEASEARRVIASDCG